MSIARTLVIAGFVIALATALLHVCALGARAQLHRAQMRAATVTFDLAFAKTKAAIADALAGGGDPQHLVVAMPVVANANVQQATFDDDAQNLQRNDSIDEGRFAVRVTVAGRDRYVLFRTFRAPPYAMVAGTRDVSAGLLSRDASLGDDAGTTQTTISVRYVNAKTGASFDGNAWHAESWKNESATSPTWDP